MILYECHKGWHKMIDSCLAELKAVGVEDRHILQVKEKMAELRIYFRSDHLSDERQCEARKIGEEKGPFDGFRQIFGHKHHIEPWRCKGEFRANEFIALATGDNSCWVFDTEKDELVNLWQ